MASPISPMIGVFQNYKRTNSIMGMHKMLIENIQSLRAGVLAEDWKQVKILAASCLGMASGAKRLLENEGDVLRGKIDTTINAFSNLDEVLKKIILSGNDDAIAGIFPKIKESLAPFPNELADFESAFKKLQNGENENVSLIKSVPNTKLLPKEPIQLTFVREMALACASRGLLGLIHADFNLSLVSAKSLIGELESFDVRSDMQSIYDEYSNNLDERSQQLYKVMAEKIPKEASLKAAIDLLDFIERKLPVFARSQAWMYHSAITLKDKGKGGAAEEIGTIAAKAGQITRESIATYVSCLRIILELASINTSDAVEELFSSASILPFKRSLPNGTDVELSKIDQCNDGDFVEISGFVVAHEAFKTADKKSISRLIILDPSSGVTARAIAIFTQLAHTGVTTGSYCRISGVYRINSTFLDGESGVEIDRLSLSERAKEDWHIAFLRLSDRWYHAWRNGTNMLWGLGPQFVIGDTNGELDDVASCFGAGELIFPPFIR